MEETGACVQRHHVFEAFPQPSKPFSLSLGRLLSCLTHFLPKLPALQVRFIRVEWQRDSAVKLQDLAWVRAKISVFKTQKRYAFEKTSRCAAGRAEKR